MSERDLSGIWFTGECEWNISGALALAVSDWAECMPTKRNIELSVTLLCFAHMLWVWEKEKLLESTAGVAESSGRIQVSVRSKMLSAVWE